MDFKIGDEIEESSEEGSSRRESKLPLIIIIVLSLVVGVSVFLICNHFFGRKEVPEEPVVATPLSLTEENVEILYAYVCYGTRNGRNDKFLKENHVTIDSFTNEEKFYYALQFAQVEDFTQTSQLNEDKKKIYNISDAKIRTYMQRFFGGKVTYTNNVELKYPFSFRIGGQNVGIMKGTNTNGGLETIFDGFEADVEPQLIEPFYTELVAAYKEPDGTYRLEEKAIFTRTEKNGDNYTVYIYKDFNQTMLIETRPNQTEQMLIDTPVSIKNLKEKAATITYHFGLYNNMLYFESSEISYN